MAAFGPYDAFDDGDGKLNLTRAIEVAYRNGAGVVFARALADGADSADFTAAFEARDQGRREHPDRAAALDVGGARVLSPILEEAENNRRT